MAGEPPADSADGDGAAERLELTDVERADLASNAHFQTELSGYSAIQGTRPQTLAYGLHDSPAGMAAWILDRFYLSSDCAGDLEATIDRDALVTNLMICWVTGTINSSMRIYYETRRAGAEVFAGGAPPSDPVPIGHTLFPAEAMRFPRRWAEAQYHLTRWTRMPRGGHFAGLEQPDLLVDEIRAFFASLDRGPTAT
jgi:microsomal epoxide hydrolase